METNPRKVFYGMFGQGDTQDERLQLLDDSGSVLDYVMSSSASLQKRLGSGDRSKLGEYLQSVREIEKRIQTAEQKGSTSELALPNRPRCSISSWS